MLDLPQPLGPMMQVRPAPAEGDVRLSQNDLKPISSTLRSLNKTTSYPGSRPPPRRANNGSDSGSSRGGNLPDASHRVLRQRDWKGRWRFGPTAWRFGSAVTNGR